MMLDRTVLLLGFIGALAAQSTGQLKPTPFILGV
jgi:hypothetical protein